MDYIYLPFSFIVLDSREFCYMSWSISIYAWQAKSFLDKNKLMDIIDPQLGDGIDPDQIKLLAMTANKCINQSSIERPEMSEVCLN